MISGNVVGASPNVLSDLVLWQPALEQASRRGDDDESEDYTALRIG